MKKKLKLKASDGLTVGNPPRKARRVKFNRGQGTEEASVYSSEYKEVYPNLYPQDKETGAAIMPTLEPLTISSNPQLQEYLDSGRKQFEKTRAFRISGDRRKDKFLANYSSKRLIENNPRGDRSLSEWKKSFTNEEMRYLQESRYSKQFNPNNSTLGRALRSHSGTGISALGGPGSKTFQLRQELGLADDLPSALETVASPFTTALELPFNLTYSTIKDDNMAEGVAGIHSKNPNLVEYLAADPLTYMGVGIVGAIGKVKHGKTAANLTSKAINKSVWKQKELPGLHLKSTMEEQAISKIVEPKTGLINVEQALAIINKEGGGADKVKIIREVLGDNIPQKMDYNQFRKLIQDELIPLERNLTTHSSNFGIRSLNYSSHNKTLLDNEELLKAYESGMAIPRNELEIPTLRNMIEYQKNNPADIIENKTLVLSNKDKLGIIGGSNKHGQPEETLGHIHFLRHKDTPNTLTATQIQSDAFQHDIVKALKDDIERYNYALTPEARNIMIKQSGKEYADLKQREAKELIIKATKELEYVTPKNPIQAKLLGKNHQERLLQELVDYAGKRGDVNKIRVPTPETASKIQGFGSHENIISYKKELLKNADNQAMRHALEIEITILKKYSEQPKMIKKLFGVEPKLVTDSKGNTWYEFDIPKKFKEGKGEIRAFEAAIPATGAAELIRRETTSDNKPKLKDGASINSFEQHMVEAEGGELILRNSHGDLAIIPAKYKLEVQDMVKGSCFRCIDNLVQTLPTVDNYKEDGYAEDGLLLPGDPINPSAFTVSALEERSRNLTRDNSQLNFVQRANNPDNYPYLTDESTGERITHKMSYAEQDGRYVMFPTVVQKGDYLHDFGDDWKTALDYARESGELIETEKRELAEYYTSKGLLRK